MAETHSTIAGRASEMATLNRGLRSKEAELIAVYGRRRVGKTHLVREYCKPRAAVYFEVTGQSGAPMPVQLGHFQRELERVLYPGVRLPTVQTWEQGFELLASALERWPRGRAPLVVFLDEIPWLATRRSRFLESLDHAWNTRLSRIRPLCLIVCGSAASFMLDRVINAKGGLHNRVTQRIRLQPFSVAETKAFLEQRGIRLGRRQVLELYLALGGVPHYLRHVARGQSATQAVGAICFDRSGPLYDEFDRLFTSLFQDSDRHEAIVRALGAKKHGMTRIELLQATSLPSGGGFARMLRALEEADFIGGFVPFGRKIKDASYRLIDEFTTFHLTWIERAPRGVLAGNGAKHWASRARMPSYRAWAGYAFEGLCLKHAGALQHALGLDAVSAVPSTWRWVPPTRSKALGAQIDLLFDRSDGVITLCEIKYTAEPFKLTKAYARTLATKVEVFRERTRTTKDVQLALITPMTPAPSLWLDEVIDAVVTADALFLN